MDEFITVGTVIKPQGIRGELKVLPLTDEPKRFLQLKKVYLRQNNTQQQVRVMGARVGADAVYLFLERCYDRNAAELLRGADLLIDREDAVKLPEGRYFIVDLVGCTVYDRAGNSLGKLTEVLQPGANDVYVVQKENGEELLIPAVSTFVDSIDIAARRVTVNADMLQQEEIRDN